jgi:pilus assembly protein CpaF
MFTIVISEKGGAERRETFDKNEINVGRVQGNDLMLPKGNVSKHHARLLFRDGRFIVTDLKSTNGTYVNGRKITQATIVREGDKIYIGDFVLRLETAAQAGASADATYGPNEDSSQGRTPARIGPLPREATPAPPPAIPPPMASPMVGPPPGPPPPLAPPPLPPQVSAGPMASGANALAPVPPPMVQPATPRSAEHQSVSHYPLEREPEDSESGPEMRGAPVPRAPAPPRIPHAEPRPARTSSGHGVQRAGGHSVSAATPVRAIVAPAGGRALPRDTPQQAARRLALITLVDRVADVVNLAALDQSPSVDEVLSQQIDRAVREQAKAMREEGEAPEGTDLDLLARDALRELVALGPIGPLLEDEETQEIHVARTDYVLALKSGQLTLADPSFTSEDALRRVIARLAHQSGEPRQPGEVVVERRLSRGAHMVAIGPPAANSWVLTVRKRGRAESSLDEMLRVGAISRPMASFLEACLVARANVLVVGAGPGAVVTMLAALASVAPVGERIAILQDNDEITVPQAQVVPLLLPYRDLRSEEAVRAAARLGLDRLIVSSLAGSAAAATIDAIGEGAEGVLAGVGAPSLRHGLGRLAAQIALARPGASVDAAREALGESFDVVIEAVRAADGRVRALRVAELSGSDAKGATIRDIFVLSADGTGEGAYVATGAVPRIANDFAARGVKMDGSMFKRR